MVSSIICRLFLAMVASGEFPIALYL